ncbi:4Fe-4S dicluster domain-containing protein [Candidatus Bathyarchaeota archaeon]|nr:4Fe-4S dicluster domain-containing protein [Candidatus Bathyarchaeota archaeon]
MSENEVVKPSRIDPKFRYEVIKVPGGENLLQCFQCGTCTSDCPIARFNEKYRPRKIIRMAQLGLKDKIVESDFLWLCASCFTCTDRCPQGVEVASVIRALKNIAAKEGFIPQIFKTQLSNVIKTGYVYRIPESRIKRREALGLPPLPRGNSENITKSIQKLEIMKILEE